MSTSRRWALVASFSALIGAGVALTVRHVVRADGIPTMTPLIYRGYLEDGGRPVPDGRRMIEASLWPDATTTDVVMRFCRVVVPDLPVTDGRFELRLNDECLAAVRANRDPWLQITVGGTALPRTKLGAVPYAVEADRASNAAGPLLARIAALEARATAAEARVSDDCPPGWTLLATEAGFTDPMTNLRRLCRKPLPDGSVDEVVRVGRPPSVFWIDRYEASVVRAAPPYARMFESDTDLTGPEPPMLLRNGRWNLESGVPRPLSAPYYARSTAPVAPARWVTWFQASELCRMAGKRLPTGDEWITAALGTNDPAAPNDGADDADCNTQGTGPTATPRQTGRGSGCRSSWGAQDMVGNVWEWTTEWYAGVGNQTNFTPAMQAGARVNDPYDAWPSGYGTDGTWNVNSVVARASGEDNRIGIPSAAFRGGDWPDGTRAGVYSLYLHTGPSFWVSRRIPLRSATVGVGRSDFFRFMS